MVMIVICIKVTNVTSVTSQIHGELGKVALEFAVYRLAQLLSKI